MDPDMTVPCGSGLINIRVGAIILKNGKFLMVGNDRNNYLYSVGGRLKFGETAEEAVKREVFEETGLKVKNIRYYKSQPWGMAQDILMGFFCEAEGDSVIRMDSNELKYAQWVKREDIVLQPNNLSLTNEMMQVFREKTIM